MSNQLKYEHELIKTLDRVREGKRIKDKTILRLIPKSENQYLIFYSMTYPERKDETRKAFYKFDSIIMDRANRCINIFNQYILLSQFVDGEYAESYFENLEFLIMQNKQKFCLFYSKEAEKLKRLHIYYTENCGEY